MKYLITKFKELFFSEKDILKPLSCYFKAVNLDNINKEEKIEEIIKCFSTNSIILDSSGNKYEGKEGVRNFYDSNYSPVLKTGFKATPIEETATKNNEYISVVIILQNKETKFKVGDWFKMENGLIKELHIFKGELKE